MELCSSGHDEVCYDGRKCPACELYEETKKEYDDQIVLLNQELTERNE